MENQSFKRTYIWELPVRFFHWINALALVSLIVTGYLIAHPPGIISRAEASAQFWFGYIRKIHFVSAYLMVAVMIMRVYWAFKGNAFANWKVFLPFSKSAREKMVHTLKYEIFLQKYPENKKKYSDMGHNNVAALSYLMMFLLALVMIATGFGLYAPTSTWFFPKLFAWVPEFVGGDMNARLIHHVSMWGFILFIVVHVYLVLFHDWLEGTGESSSMISGYKFEDPKVIEQK